MPFDDNKIAELRAEAFKVIGPDHEVIRAAVQSVCDAYDEEISDLEDEVRKLNREEVDDERVDDAVNSFLDEVQRPVGKLTFTVPQSPSVDRAILALHDAVKRGL
jgi:hypothetical protein